MLQKLNAKIQGVVAWVIIILIAFTFTLFGVDYYIQAHNHANEEIVINGEAVSHQQFEARYRRARQTRDPAQYSFEQDKELKQQVLDELITNRVTLQTARKQGFTVNPDQANAAIVAIPQFQENGHFSPERYQQALSGALFTQETFFQEVKQGMLLNQVRFAMMGTAFVLPSELKHYVKLYMQTRDYRYLTIPSQIFADDVTISVRQTEDYYKHHQAEFLDPEKVKIEYVSLSTSAIRETISPSDKKIRAYYDLNKGNYKMPAQWKVAHLFFAYPDNASKEQKEKVAEKAEKAAETLHENPDKFPEMVKKMSDDKLSVAARGELPWITAGQTYMDKGLLALKKPGQISEPFVSKKGIQIFKLLEYKPAQTRPLAAVYDQIKGQLIADATQRQFADKLEKLTDLAFQTPDTLEPIVKELNLSLQSSKPFSRDGTKEGIASNQQVVNTAFGHEVLELENNSEPLQLNNDEVIVLRVKEHIPAKEQPLTAVRDKIRKKLTRKAAEEKAVEWGKSLASGQKTHADLKKALGSNAPKWKSVTDAGRETDKAPGLANHLAFNIAAPNKKEGELTEEGDFVLVELKAVHDGDIQKLDSEQKIAIQQQLESSYGMMDYEYYVAGAMKSAKVER